MKQKMNVHVNAIVPIEIDAEESFRLLCKCLDMDFILKDEDYVVKENEWEEKVVYLNDEIIDDRGELFESLMNLAKNIFPNV